MLKQFTNYKGQKQNIDFSLAFSDNMGSSSKANNKWIVAHSTATPNAPAKNIATYMRNNWSSVQSYVHFAIDDTSCYAIGEQGYVAWGAGPTANNNSPVQVELCEFTDKTRALNAYKNYVNFLRDASRDTGISLDNIKTHKWFSTTYHETNHVDPNLYLNSIGISDEQFRKDLASGFSSGSTGASTGQTGASQGNSGSTKFKLNVDLTLYKGADLSNPIGKVTKGTTVSYSKKLVGTTYTWLKIDNGYIIASVNEKKNGQFI